MTTHGTDLVGYEKWPQFRRYADAAVDKCARIIAISQNNYQATIDTFPQAAGKALLLPNGYNDGIFFVEDAERAALLAEYGVPYHGERIVFFAGKLTDLKGADILLQAAQKYENLPPRNITVIAGTGQKAEELKQLKEELKLRSVYFIGHRNQHELRRLYSNADIFVIPSRYEAFGLVALEAMACGLPVVASKVGGLSDFVTSEVGALVQAEDPDALSDAVMQELLRSQQTAGRRSAVAQYAFERYSQANFIQELENIYLDTKKR
jgi:glycosyltransferase involved in cell wall biosynthesis